MSKFRTYVELFSILGKGEGFGIKETEPAVRQSLIAKLADDDCLGEERFFGAREDIVATAKVREVRRYACSCCMYVRYEFRVLDPHGDWSGRYQLLAIFGKTDRIQAYTIVRGKTRKEIIPTELKAKDVGYVYVARELKRALMKAKRLHRAESIKTLEKIGVGDAHDKMAYRIPIRDLTWERIIRGWRKRGTRYRDNALVYLAMRGDTNAMCEIGHWLDVTKEESEYWSDPKLAEYWFGKAADAGNPMGQSRLATLVAGDCDKSDMVSRNKMLALLEAAAAQDFPSALKCLSKCYRCDRCGVYDAIKSAEYHLRYEEVKSQADDSGRLPIHRTTRYGHFTKELMV